MESKQDSVAGTPLEHQFQSRKELQLLYCPIVTGKILFHLRCEDLKVFLPS